MPDTGGDVLCPTCGQWTPPAPFCSECGATLRVGFDEPADGGGGAFRRGHEVDQPGSPWGAPGERFEPEPEDEAARAAAAAAGAAGAAHVDHLAEAEPSWPPTDSAAAPPPADAPTPVSEPEAPAPKPRSAAKAAAVAGAAGVAAGAAAGAAPAANPAPPPGPEPAASTEPSAFAEPPPPPSAPPPVTYAGPPRNGDDGGSGVTPVVFVVFLGIGVLALLGGALLPGLLDGPVAEASPTPSIVATPTPEPLPSLTPDPSSGPSGVAPTPTPAVTPPPAADGFLARTEPCAEPPTSPTCDNSGAENNGDVWILVSFRHAQATDVIAASIHDESGALVEESRPVALAFCGTSTDCAGWTFLEFHNLDDGDYEARVSRNGSQVATTEFTVN